MVAARLPEAFVREAPVAVLVYDVESGACTATSRGADVMLAGGADGLMAAPLAAGAWWKPPALIDAMRDSSASGTAVVHVEGVTAPGGAALILSYRIQPAVADGRTLLFTWIEDVTHRDDCGEWRIAAERNDAIVGVVGDIAHQFDNLLTVITSYGGLMRHAMPADDPSRADLEEILSAAESAIALSAEFRTLRRARGGRIEPVDLGEVVLRVVRILKRLAGPGASLRVQPPPGGGCVVEANPADVEHALVNALLLARELADGQGALDLSVQRREGRQGGECRVLIGLPQPVAAPGDRSRLDGLAASFLQGPASAGSYGSGLSLAERVVRGCGGSLRIAAPEYAAATVELAFPAELARGR